MTRFQLFFEYNDAVLWGDTLADALLRAKQLIPRAPMVRLDNAHGTHFVPDKVVPQPRVISRVIGMRDTSNSTRGSWAIVSAVTELTDGRIIEIDARVLEQLAN